MQLLYPDPAPVRHARHTLTLAASFEDRSRVQYHPMAEMTAMSGGEEPAEIVEEEERSSAVWTRKCGNHHHQPTHQPPLALTSVDQRSPPTPHPT